MSGGGTWKRVFGGLVDRNVRRHYYGAKDMDDKEMRHMLDNLRLIHAAYDANGDDLSAWPWKAADEIERLHKRCHPSNVVMIGDAGHYVSEAVAAEIERLKKLNKVLEAAFMEAAKQIAKSDPVGVARWLREQGL